MSSASDPRFSATGPDEFANLIFVGFNSRIAAVDRHSGDVVWTWVSPKGSGFVAVLLDGDRLIASVQGYTHCLDPATGTELWNNPLKGMGIGTPCLASVRGNTTPQLYAILAQQEAEQAETQATSSHQGPPLGTAGSTQPTSITTTRR